MGNESLYADEYDEDEDEDWFKLTI
jgi:hypothetical protein